MCDFVCADVCNWIFSAHCFAIRQKGPRRSSWRVRRCKCFERTLNIEWNCNKMVCACVHFAVSLPWILNLVRWPCQNVALPIIRLHGQYQMDGSYRLFPIVMALNRLDIFIWMCLYSNTAYVRVYCISLLFVADLYFC